ncbi:MAG: cation transporter [Chloroflexi bacterium]|nr:cation transporter [Chloroflexota bacterium]
MEHPHLPDLTRQITRRMALSLVITLVFVAVEVVAGLLANSLALLTDAAHNFTDVLALGLSWFALRLALQPSHSAKTFGYHRAGILVALLNSTTLALISLGIFYEAYRRFIDPPEVEAGILIWVGLAAVAVNLVTALLVRRGAEHDLNIRSAFLHLMGDVLSTVGAVIAGVVIFFTGLDWLDPLVSVFIGILILWNAWKIIREATEILMEATPADIDMDALIGDIQAVEGVTGVHDLHVWSINQSLRTLSAHLVTTDLPVSAGTGIQLAVSAMLRSRYGIAHSTLQLECKDCAPAALYCDFQPASRIHLE